MEMDIPQLTAELARANEALHREVAKRRFAEDALRASESELRLTLDTLPAGIIVVSPETGITDANKRLLGYLGRTLEILKQWTTTDMVHPDDFGGTLKYFRTFMTLDRESRFETRIRRFDGVYRWFQVRNNPLRDADGRILRWYGVLTDIDDQKKAELALRESEGQLRLVVNTTPGLIATFAPSGAAEDVNAQFLEYLGQTLEEFSNWPTNGTVHPADVEHHVEVLRGSFHSGRPIDTETRLRRFDGAYRWFQVRGLPAKDADGRIIRWYCLMNDIDDRKHAEQALAASERNLQVTVDAIPALAWSAHPDGAADFFNQHYLDYVGRSLDDLADWGWTSGVHPEDLQRLGAAWEKARETGSSAECETRLCGADAKYRWFIFRASPLRDETGAVVRWYGINTDIEDRKRAEDELVKSEASLAHAQRVSSTGSFVWILATREITFFSEELYRIFELDSSVPITVEQIATRVHPDDIPLLTTKLAEAQAGIVDHDYDIRLRMPDGRVKYLRTESRPDTQVDGQKIFVGTMQDITERRLAEEAVNELRTELAYVSRVSTLGAMTASIAHEVNQPLSGIITNASTGLRMLASNPPDIEGARETARRTIRDGNRAAEVVSKLRALFSKKSETTESVDLNEAVRDLLALTTIELRRGRVDLEVDLAPDLPKIVGDRVQLQQVVLNLLLNAADAVSEIEDLPRRVTLSTGMDEDGQVKLTVKDNGVGIDPESINRLFDAFYTTKPTGMGIGLSVSRSIIEHHRGRIWASRNADTGASFSFAIPQPAVQVVPTEPAGHTPQGAKASHEGSPNA
ncbi:MULTISPECIES: PAS domain-containing protein [unclassified Mesorhizobium]|uniref:PAS domain-containing sensor histidine kinase n=1 Tax=unclassified Mesorhizobium TaxID=325217 RepID=UPI001CC930CA|nr:MULTISPECIES: PAS domain-containing protein [unclassified Mesorhizobium]MBZ9817361.1 PAS domain-containing protein [Mesorhizobium sp. CA7]MBZ9863344.1 PAS domain-containing protein [Mesorhizobium sp. CA12]MBZ9885105.1 PAS domain-containing protein [Mesorhizobium sp. CA10]